MFRRHGKAVAPIAGGVPTASALRLGVNDEGFGEPSGAIALEEVSPLGGREGGGLGLFDPYASEGVDVEAVRDALDIIAGGHKGCLEEMTVAGSRKIARTIFVIYATMRPSKWRSRARDIGEQKEPTPLGEPEPEPSAGLLDRLSEFGDHHQPEALLDGLLGGRLGGEEVVAEADGGRFLGVLLGEGVELRDDGGGGGGHFFVWFGFWFGVAHGDKRTIARGSEKRKKNLSSKLNSFA